MARIRSIKPEFPFSEQIGELSRDARLFFVESWMVCDRRGRYVWEPVKLAKQLFPYDQDADLEAWLREVVAQDLAVAYEFGGQRYVWIPKFTDHQRPHPKEPAADIPECPDGALRRHIPWAVESRDLSGQTISKPGEPGQNTANHENVTSRVLPGTFPSSPVGIVSGEWYLENAASPSSPPEASPRPSPLIRKRDLSAAWQGRIFTIPQAWADKFIAAGNGTVTPADIRAFGQSTQDRLEATGEAVDTSVHLFAWLDVQWRTWQQQRAVDAVEARHKREMAESEAKRKAFMAEVEAARDEPLVPFTRVPKAATC